MRVYLDNCCFNRPFDDQGQARIRLEAEAKLIIQENIRAGRIELAWSYILDYENTANPFPERRHGIAEWKEQAIIDIEESKAILKLAKSFEGTGLKAKDALHVGCAIISESKYFITTDDNILRRGKDISEIAILDPFSFIREFKL